MSKLLERVKIELDDDDNNSDSESEKNQEKNINFNVIIKPAEILNKKDFVENTEIEAKWTFHF